jgi:hypothetical protein
MKRWQIETVIAAILGGSGSVLLEAFVVLPIVDRHESASFGLLALRNVPLVAMYLFVAFRTASWKELLGRAALLAIVAVLVGATASLLRLPGTEEGLFWEAPATFWWTSPVVNFAISLTVLGFLFGVRSAARRLRGAV